MTYILIDTDQNYSDKLQSKDQQLLTFA